MAVMMATKLLNKKSMADIRTRNSDLMLLTGDPSLKMFLLSHQSKGKNLSNFIQASQELPKRSTRTVAVIYIAHPSRLIFTNWSIAQVKRLWLLSLELIGANLAMT